MNRPEPCARGAEVDLGPDVAQCPSGHGHRDVCPAQNALAHDGLFGSLKCFFNGSRFGVIRSVFAFGNSAESGCGFFVQVIHAAIKLCFGERFVEQFVHWAADAVKHIFLQGFVGGEVFGFAFGLADLGLHLNLQVDDGLHGFVTEFERLDHHFLGDFVCAAFDHQDGVFGARNAQVQVGSVYLVEGGVDNEFAVDASNTHCANRAVPGDI